MNGKRIIDGLKEAVAHASGAPGKYVMYFHARTFADANAKASEYLKSVNATEITSQHHETTGGWTATVYYRIPEHGPATATQALSTDADRKVD